MTKILTLLICALLSSLKSYEQVIDSLQLVGKEIPENYVLTDESNCISVQACTFYDNPEMYEILIGKLKTKRVQNFDGRKDKGSIMYFEFDEAFKGEAFLEGLLWGGDRPTREHPEQFYTKGNFLVIWSFKKESLITRTSKEKVKSNLE